MSSVAGLSNNQSNSYYAQLSKGKDKSSADSQATNTASSSGSTSSAPASGAPTSSTTSASSSTTSSTSTAATAASSSGSSASATGAANASVQSTAAKASANTVATASPAATAAAKTASKASGADGVDLAALQRMMVSRQLVEQLTDFAAQLKSGGDGGLDRASSSTTERSTGTLERPAASSSANQPAIPAGVLKAYATAAA